MMSHPNSYTRFIWLHHHSVKGPSECATFHGKYIATDGLCFNYLKLCVTAVPIPPKVVVVCFHIWADFAALRGRRKCYLVQARNTSHWLWYCGSSSDLFISFFVPVWCGRQDVKTVRRESTKSDIFMAHFTHL